MRRRAATRFGTSETRYNVAGSVAVVVLALMLGGCGGTYACEPPLSEGACAAAVSGATTWLAESELPVEPRAMSVMADADRDEPNAVWNGLAEVRFEDLQAKTSFAVSVCADTSRCAAFRPVYIGNLPGPS